jgi:folate-binding protein YgfZ
MSPTEALSGSALPELLRQAHQLAAHGPVDTGPLLQAVRRFDLSAAGLDRLRISGRDRHRFLHAMLSHDVQSLKPGEGRWATFNNAQGRTVSDVRLFQVDPDPKEGFLLALLEPGASQRFVEGLEKYVIAEKVRFEPDAASSLLLLAGAGADAALAASGAELPPQGAYRHVLTRVGDRPVRLLRLDRSGREARDLLLWFDAADRAAVDAALDGIPSGDPFLLDAARIEDGQPRFGLDFTESEIPLEAGLKNRALSFTKGCYLGQEVICRIDSLGAPAKALLRLQIDGDGAPEPGTSLWKDGKQVGFVTSAVNSARLGGVRALGYLRKRSNEPGTLVQVGAADSARTALAGEPL